MVFQDTDLTSREAPPQKRIVQELKVAKSTLRRDQNAIIALNETGHADPFEYKISDQPVMDKDGKVEPGYVLVQRYDGSDWQKVDTVSGHGLIEGNRILDDFNGILDPSNKKLKRDSPEFEQKVRDVMLNKAKELKAKEIEAKAAKQNQKRHSTPLHNIVVGGRQTLSNLRAQIHSSPRNTR